MSISRLGNFKPLLYLDDHNPLDFLVLRGESSSIGSLVLSLLQTYLNQGKGRLQIIAQSEGGLISPLSPVGCGLHSFYSSSYQIGHYKVVFEVIVREFLT